MKKGNPEITVGMPVYNERKFIEKTLESLLNQTYQNFEVVISDNSSTDGTDKICEEYAKKEKRIKFFRQKKNLGALKNFKFVLDQAKTPFFIWLSGHDIWHPQLLEKLLNSFKKSNDDKIILVFPKVIDSSSNTEYTWIQKEDTSEIENAIERYKRILEDLGSFTIYGLWKKEVLEKINFPETIVSDAYMLAQGALIGKYKFEPEAIVYRTINHPIFIGTEDNLFRQILHLKPHNKFYYMIYHSIIDKIPGKYRESILRLVLVPEEIKFIFESVRICLLADKLNSNISQKQKIYLALWSVHILPYLLYKTMPDSKILQLYAKFCEFSSKILKKVKNL
ncbi:Putative glycosyltransferase EpsE [bacterium HR19]|nr:Putative glycosyltransferase EpsE [bacterium HR19]